ncbi:MAG: enoyl-CoA hydratase-related protein [Dehalococcoidia bacterium]
MAERDVRYEVEGPIARVTLDRPRYRNAQSWRLLDQLDEAFDQAVADDSVKVIVVRGAGGNFSAGHDLGTPDQIEDREQRGAAEHGIGYYDNFRHYNLDLTLKWRNLPKPTIAMVEGYCIYGGWMIAAAMDIVFAARSAQFLTALLEYFSATWDVGPRKAKELLFESRFVGAEEAQELGFVNRVVDDEELEAETMAYAGRVAENSRWALRMAKVAVNRAQDIQGFSAAVEAGFADYLVVSRLSKSDGRREGERRLPGVDLALRGLRGERGGGQGGPPAAL